MSGAHKHTKRLVRRKRKARRQRQERRLRRQERQVNDVALPLLVAQMPDLFDGKGHAYTQIVTGATTRLYVDGRLYAER